MLIRPLKEEDRPIVSEVRAEAWRKTYPGLLPQHIIEAATGPGRKHGLLVPDRIASSRIGFVACLEEKICGFAAGGLPRESIVPADCELWAIYVHPSFQGRGLGEALLGEFKSAMAKGGRKTLLLWTLKENASARLFYEKQGGTLAPHEKMFLWEGEEIAPEVAYVWDLYP